jgi:hypothetical protein
LSHDAQRAAFVCALEAERAVVRKAKDRDRNGRTWAKYGAAINENKKLKRRALGIGPRTRLSEEERLRKNRCGQLKAKYGITLADKEAMFAAQGNACAICKTTKFGKRSAHTDHCHESGKVRGILCARCNRGLAYFRDNPEIFRVAANYLEASR